MKNIFSKIINPSGPISMKSEIKSFKVAGAEALTKPIISETQENTPLVDPRYTHDPLVRGMSNLVGQNVAAPMEPQPAVEEVPATPVDIQPAAPAPQPEQYNPLNNVIPLFPEQNNVPVDDAQKPLDKPGEFNDKVEAPTTPVEGTNIFDAPVVNPDIASDVKVEPIPESTPVEEAPVEAVLPDQITQLKNQFFEDIKPSLEKYEKGLRELIQRGVSEELNAISAAVAEATRGLGSTQSYEEMPSAQSIGR